MNLKIRLALLFSVLVAIILAVSCTTIYLLFKSYRTEDYKQRLVKEAEDFNDAFNLANIIDSTTPDSFKQFPNSTLSYLNTTLVNSRYKIIYKQLSDTAITYFKDTSLYQKIKKEKVHSFNLSNNREAVGIYFDANNAYIIISAIDINGFKKLQTLRYILFGVFCGALIITGLIAFFFVQQALSPLVKLSSQMQETSATNLWIQIDENNNYDEINTIARNFNAMLKRLNDAFERQRTFVQNASHELRTPLATMLSQTEAALNRNLDIEGYKKVMKSLKEDQTDLIELTNSLLLISQYEKIANSGDWPLIRVDEMLYDTVASCKRMLPKIDISIDFKTLPEDENELMVKGNDSLLKSVFSNLIKNAYKYSDNKKVNIVIETGSPYMNIQFINSGKQLQQGEVDKMKMPFFRGDNAITKKGYGLGLAIVTTILDLHKGKITYTALGDNVNQFTISLLGVL